MAGRDLPPQLLPPCREQIQHIQSDSPMGSGQPYGPSPLQPGSPQQQAQHGAHDLHGLHEGPPGPFMRRRPGGGGGGGGSSMIDEFEQVTAHLEGEHLGLAGLCMGCLRLLWYSGIGRRLADGR